MFSKNKKLVLWEVVVTSHFSPLLPVSLWFYIFFNYCVFVYQKPLGRIAYKRILTHLYCFCVKVRLNLR